MICEEARESWLDLWLGELGVAEAGLLRAHAEQCPRCAEEGERVRTEVGVLQAGLAHDRLASPLREQVLSALPLPRSERAAWRRFAAAAVLAILAAYGSGHRPARQEPSVAFVPREAPPPVAPKGCVIVDANGPWTVLQAVPPAVWEGNAGNGVFDDPRNWKNDVAPTPGVDVYVAAVSPSASYPVVQMDFTCPTLHIDPGANLTVNGGQFQVAQTLDSQGAINVTNGVFSVSGEVCHLANLTTTNGSVFFTTLATPAREVTVDSSQTLSVSNDLSMRTLTLADSSTFAVTSGDVTVSGWVSLAPKSCWKQSGGRVYLMGPLRKGGTYALQSGQVYASGGLASEGRFVIAREATSSPQVTWTGASEDSSWDIAVNWSPPTVPDASSTVLIVPARSRRLPVVRRNADCAGLRLSRDTAVYLTPGALLRVKGSFEDDGGEIRMLDAR